MPDVKKLTTGEIASKRFTPVRMREGYSTDEVDEFLELVERTIEAYDDDYQELTRAYNDLKSRPAAQPVQDTGALSAAQAEVAKLRKQLTDEQARTATFQENLQKLGNQLIEARQAAENAKANAAASKAFDSSELDMSSATGIIARMLENAAKQHDDLIAQGESEALRLRDEAQEEYSRAMAEAEAQIAAKLAEAVKNDTMVNLEARQQSLQLVVEELERTEKQTRQTLIEAHEKALQELKASDYQVS